MFVENTDFDVRALLICPHIAFVPITLQGKQSFFTV